MLILTVEVTYERFDEEVHTRLSMIDDVRPHTLDSLGEYKDFSSIRLVDIDLVKEMFHYYIRNTEIQERSMTYQGLLDYAPMDPFDNFLIYIVLPIILDIGAFDLYEFINKQETFNHSVICYDSLIFREETIAINFLCRV